MTAAEPASPVRAVTLRLQAHVRDGGVVIGEGAGVHGVLRDVESELAPLSEGATIALATGLALAGKRVVVELVDPRGLARAADALADLADLAARSSGAFRPTVLIRVPGGSDTSALPLPRFVAGRDSDAAEQLDAALARGGACVLVDDTSAGAPSGVPAADLGVPLELRAGTVVTVIAAGEALPRALDAAATATAAGVDTGVVEWRGGEALPGPSATGRIVAVDVPLLSTLHASFWTLEAPWATLPRGADTAAILGAIHTVAAS